ncbi:MAG TPA: phosphoenolpyruvate--protein phosphotransferase [Thermodesulfobacteriota bacterium]|nr:phosphoenolpyruvate--protein phosphotransferase [Thermodesulfobacteriota bacterium]
MEENFLLRGIGVSQGVAIGKAFLLKRSKVEVSKYSQIPPEEIPGEVERFKAAIEETRRNLVAVREKIRQKGFQEASHIMDAQLMIIEDRALVDRTIQHIEEDQIDAAGALKSTLQDIHKAFEDIGDEYLRERKSDIDFLGERIMRNLLGKEQEFIARIQDKVILVANDLSPVDTANLDVTKVLGFVTDRGGKTSHTAIMARALEIPAVVGLESITQEVNTGDMVIVDGIIGVVIVNPTPETLREYADKKLRYEDLEKELFRYKQLPAETKDGFRIKVYANIELVEELPSVLEHGAEGIGLYRTEFLYLNRKDLPTEEEHFAIYKSVVEKISPYPVTIRTIDLGGDKFISQIELAEEMNPAMGLRAIRFCLKEVGIFKTQLRAILRASAFGKVRLMFPMISGFQEIIQIKSILQEVKEDLVNKNQSFDPELEIGIMIEIPSAVTIADLLAREVDFFSIGTNDLIQYSLAIDRVNEHVSYLYEPLHPAVLRVISNVIDAAHNAGIRVSMCGEMAGESMYVPILVGLGLDELSMNALSILKVKKMIRSVSYRESREFIKEIYKMYTASEIESYLRQETLNHLTG